MEIIYGVCSWGLGHATRSLPVIRKLIHEKNNVTVISNRRSLEVLKKELREDPAYVDIPDYPMLVSENTRQFLAKSMVYWPVFIKRIEDGLTQLQKILDKKHYDCIVSDARYDMYSKKIPSFFISHQMRIMNPLQIKMFERAMEQFNLFFFRQFFNPAFNYLSTIGLLAPGCRRRGIPLCLYNASVGPIHTGRGAAALQKVLDASPVAVLRDEASARVIRDWNLRAPELIQGADCALNTTPPGPDQLREFFRRLGIEDEGRPALGFKVNPYIAAWKGGGGEFGRKRFVGLMAGVLDRLVGSLDADVVFFVTQVMDHTITREIVAASRRRERIRIASNPEYAYDELAGIMSRLRLLVGMRTHALILSCSVGTPIVNVNAYPKSRGFLSTLGMDHWSLDMDTLDAESLHATVMRAWAETDSTRAHLLPAVERERRLGVG